MKKIILNSTVVQKKSLSLFLSLLLNEIKPYSKDSSEKIINANASNETEFFTKLALNKRLIEYIEIPKPPTIAVLIL